MACKKSELVSAINSFGSAHTTGDSNLQAFAAQLVGQYIDTLEFAEEDPETEVAAEAAE